jgi:hypothetical protein
VASGVTLHGPHGDERACLEPAYRMRLAYHLDSASRHSGIGRSIGATARFAKVDMWVQVQLLITVSRACVLGALCRAQGPADRVVVLDYVPHVPPLYFDKHRRTIGTYHHGSVSNSARCTTKFRASEYRQFPNGSPPGNYLGISNCSPK